ncbi:glycoside hydrolase family 2 TIM barrel-domain containing protein [Mongoliitalea lutea]|nr:glycoside hydrolase family 2 TIM barrel-domain containing protein [Mongoliitalea lutea]
MLFLLACVSAQNNQITVIHDDSGMRLQVDGKDFMVNGMNWDYFPIGTNYNYNLWKKSDAFIQKALDDEMSLLQTMGVNAIRVYTGIPAKWITYIYENYGIYTMLNHSFGRYGVEVDATWMANTEYADPRVQKILLDEVRQMTQDYKNTPGLLLYLLGNENNYGLFWGGAETEDIPVQDKESTKRARAMYRLFNEATLEMKKISTNHPVSICNGDLLFLEIIAEECKDIDIFGINIYRGVSFGDTYDRVLKELNKPVLLTELGADAYHSIKNEEDQESQAMYLVANWKEMYEQAAGMGKAGNSLGGFTFQFSDGWWKVGQTRDLSKHNTESTWSNGGYFHDFIEGQNNMNEEWFGICAKGPTDNQGHYSLHPRAAYFALQQVHQLDPYAKGMTPERIQQHFDTINLQESVAKAKSFQEGPDT